jgi:hypothetical protein
VSGTATAGKPRPRHTSQAETAMSKYNADQTGPNTDAGGFQDGLFKAAYQVGIDGIVKADPKAATAKHAAMETARPANSRVKLTIDLQRLTCLVRAKPRRQSLEAFL